MWALLIGLFGGCIGSTAEYRTDERPVVVANVQGVWVVDWTKPPRLDSVPSKYEYRFRTLPEYRDYVAKRGQGLQVTIRPNHHAVLRYADGAEQDYFWRGVKNPKYDLWLQMPVFMSASIGHGFKLTSVDTAILNFELEWDENSATRVPLVLRRTK